MNQSHVVKCSIGSWFSLSKGVYHEWEVPTILRMIPPFNIQCFIAFVFVFALNNDTHFLNLDTQIDDTGECLDKTCITSQIKYKKLNERTNSDMCDRPGWGKEKLWKTVLKIQLQDQQCPNDSGHACKWVWQLHLLVITI